MDQKFQFIPYFPSLYSSPFPFYYYQQPEERTLPFLNEIEVKPKLFGKKKKYERTWSKLEVEEIFNLAIQHSQKCNKGIEDLTLDDFALISIGKRQSPEEIMKKVKEIKVNGTLRPGKWSIFEDDLLTSLVSKHRKNWGTIANELNMEFHERVNIRNSKTCKERWNNYLDPCINRGAWTMQEDVLILEQYLKYGNKWKLVSKAVPNRIESYVKNRIKSILHKLKNSLSEGKTIDQSIRELIQKHQETILQEYVTTKNLILN